eukprot:4115929-Prorocentrum_lima.AAC.1
MASVGRPSLCPPHIFKRVDLPQGYHLVIDNAWGLMLSSERGFPPSTGPTGTHQHHHLPSRLHPLKQP